MIRSTFATFDVLDISLAPKLVNERVDNLPQLQPCCASCNCQMHSLGVVVGDIDQAYEQCSRERAWAGWLRLRDLWGDKPLAIDKFDRKHAVTGNDFSKRCHSLPLDMMQQSVFAFLAARYIVEVGDKAYELGGLPMGLVLSGTALSLNMVMVEDVDRIKLHNDSEFQNEISHWS